MKFNTIIRLSTPILKTLVTQIQNISTNTVTADLVGRSYLIPANFNTADLQSVLWTAFDLKYVLTHGCYEVNNIKSRKITVLMHNPFLETEAAANSAAKLLNAHLNVIIDPLWDTQEFLSDTGSFLSTCCDIIFCSSKYQSKIEKLAEGSIIPVVAVKSCIYATLDVLAHLMTLQEKYGSLTNLNIAWIGSPCPLINTYLCIAPNFGINMQYCCACSKDASMSPASLPVGKARSQKEHTSLQECTTATSAINKANVIVVSKHNVSDFKVTLQLISENADKNWSFLHTLPRGKDEVEPEVFDHKNSLVWESKRNLQWIYAALMVRLLSHYSHVSEMPPFKKTVK